MVVVVNKWVMVMGVGCSRMMMVTSRCLVGVAEVIIDIMVQVMVEDMVVLVPTEGEGEGGEGVEDGVEVVMVVGAGGELAADQSGVGPDLEEVDLTAAVGVVERIDQEMTRKGDRNPGRIKAEARVTQKD